MKALQAIRLVARIHKTARGHGIERVTRPTLASMIRNHAHVDTHLIAPQDRLWARVDLTKEEETLTRVKRIAGKKSKWGRKELSLGRLLGCFPLLPQSSELEPVLVTSMMGRQVAESARREGRVALRRLKEEMRGGSENIEEREDGYHIKEGLMPTLLSVDDFLADENAEATARFELIKLYLSQGYRVVVLVMRTAFFGAELSASALEYVQALRGLGAEIIEVNKNESPRMFSTVRWPKDSFIQFEGKTYAEAQDMYIATKLTEYLGLPYPSLSSSSFGEGGIFLPVGETLAFGVPMAFEPTGEKLPKEEKSATDENIRIAHNLGFASVFPVPQYIFDFYPQEKLDALGLRKRVFQPISHLDLAALAVDASHELGVHAKLYAQQRELLDRIAKAAGYEIKLQSDRPTLGLNAFQLPKGEGIVMDRDAALPELGDFVPDTNIIRMPVPFVASQCGKGGIECATNVLWVPRGPGT